MQQVPTQGIANLVERWSFVSLGEHVVKDTCIIKGKSIIMNEIKLLSSFCTEMFILHVPLQYYRTNGFHNSGNILPSHLINNGQPNLSMHTITTLKLRS